MTSLTCIRWTLYIGALISTLLILLLGYLPTRMWNEGAIESNCTIISNRNETGLCLLNRNKRTRFCSYLYVTVKYNSSYTKEFLLYSEPYNRTKIEVGRMLECWYNDNDLKLIREDPNDYLVAIGVLWVMITFSYIQLLIYERFSSSTPIRCLEVPLKEERLLEVH